MLLDRSAKGKLGDQQRDVAGRPLVLVPVGSFGSEHLAQLAPGTTATAVSVARSVASRLEETFVASPLSKEPRLERSSHDVGRMVEVDELQQAVVSLVRSMSAWAGWIVFVNSSSENDAGLAKGVFQARAEQNDVAWVPCWSSAPGGRSGDADWTPLPPIRRVLNRQHSTGPSARRPSFLARAEDMMFGEDRDSRDPDSREPCDAASERNSGTLVPVVDEVVLRLRQGEVDVHGMLRTMAFEHSY